eukprot:gene3999-4249_t
MRKQISSKDTAVHNASRVVKSSSSFDVREAENSGSYTVQFGAGDYDQHVQGVEVAAVATYPAADVTFPDKLSQPAAPAAAMPPPTLPFPWKVKAIANSSLVYVYPSTTTAKDVILSNNAIASAAMAPAIAYATTAGQHSRDTLKGITAAVATARPGQLHGATVAMADQQLAGTAAEAAGEADTSLEMASLAKATSGQGATVALATGQGHTGRGSITSEVRSTADSARWYMSPGSAASGAANIGQGGQVTLHTVNRARSSLGAASGGVLKYGISNGAFPNRHGFDVEHGDYGMAVGSRTDQQVNNDAGSAAAGFVNIARAADGNVQITNDPGAFAATAVGNAIAGGLSVGLSQSGSVYIGDYDDEYDIYNNDVLSTVRGQGSAQAGQVNIAVAPNADAFASGDVRATAAKGPAVAGAFSLANAQREAFQSVTVATMTSQGDSVAGNVGVAQAAGNAGQSSAASADAGDGNALAYLLLDSALAAQVSATGFADATSSTGQAAGIAATQATAGVQAESQASSSALAAAAFTSQAVATSDASSTTGQALATGVAVALSADSDSRTATTAGTGTGNALAAGQGWAMGILQGESTVASSATSDKAGSAGSVGLSLATGVLQAQSKSSSTASAADGSGSAVAGSLSVAALNAEATASSQGSSETGYASATAFAAGLGVLRGSATAAATASTACKDCSSNAVANALAAGLLADAAATAAADSDDNPGAALANAIAVGLISRTSIGGSARLAVGPGQALTAGFAVSAGISLKRAVAAPVNVDDQHDAAGDEEGKEDQDQGSAPTEDAEGVASRPPLADEDDATAGTDDLSVSNVSDGTDDLSEDDVISGGRGDDAAHSLSGSAERRSYQGSGVSSESNVLFIAQAYADAKSARLGGFRSQALAASLAQHIRCPHLSLFWLGAYAISDRRGLLLSDYTEQVQQLLSMRIANVSMNIETIQQHMTNIITDVPSSWLLPPRQLRELPDGVSLTWRLAVAEQGGRCGYLDVTAGVGGKGYNDFWGLGAMAGGWDAAAWAAKGLPSSGDLLLELQ